MNKIKKGDSVFVLSGKDKGKTGQVIKILPVKNKALVQGINLVKKHKKPNPNSGEQGGIVDQEAPIQSSNVAIWNDEVEKPDRVGFRVEEGKKIRFFKSNGKEIVD